MLQEFKKFILRGSVVDLAIGVVIGGAFGAVVNSVVNDILMPIVGFLTAGVDFKDLKVVLKEAVLTGGEVSVPEVAITYGNLIQVIIAFLIVAFFIFLVVKSMNKMREREEAKKPKEAPAPVVKPDDVILLEEIRDLLKK
jgi:large conductance mechanosensitive channel